MKRSICMAVVVLAGCVPDEGELGEAAQGVIPPCDGCMANGLNAASWGSAFAALDKDTLAQFGLWSSNAALSLCSSFEPGYCRMRPQWATWMRAAQPSRRINIMADLVKCIAKKSYYVADPGGIAFYGGAQLRPEALSQPWGYPIQDTLSACLLAQLDPVKGVLICLTDEQTPNNCIGPEAKYEEAVLVANLFNAHRATIIGGVDAPDPDWNHRYGAVQQVDAPADEIKYESGSCQYNSVPGTAGRHATRCTDKHGTVFEHPVTVHTPEKPRTWYYLPNGGVPPIEKPANWPAP